VKKSFVNRHGSNRGAPGFQWIRCLVLMTWILSLMATDVALAQASDYEDAKRQAAKAFKGGDFARAAGLFRQAFDFSPRGNLLFNIGFCYEKSGNRLEAIKYYKRFLDAVPNSNRRSTVQDKITELSKGLDSRYTQVIVTTEPPGAYIYLNERSSGSLGKSPVQIPLMPGKHKVIAQHKDFEPEEREITVGSDGETKVEIVLLPSEEFADVKFMVSERGVDVMVDRRRIGKSPIVGVKRIRQGKHQIIAMKQGFENWNRAITVKGGQGQTIDIQMLVEGVVESEVEDESTSSKVWPWVTMGVGTAILAGGTVTGLMASGLYDKLDEKKQRSEPIAKSDIDSGNRLVLMTNLMLGLGTAVVAGGLTWYFLEPGNVEAKGDITTVFVPIEQGGAIQIGGRF